VTVLEDIFRLVEAGRTLAALGMLKFYVIHSLEDKGLSLTRVIDQVREESCRRILRALLVQPILTDEVWKVFVPQMDPEEVRELALKVEYCVSDL
jgi:hypothetical protein